MIKSPLQRGLRFNTKPGLVYYRDFTDDGYLLISAYFVDNFGVGIRLVDLSNNTVVKSWYPDPHEIRRISKYPKIQHAHRFEPQSPYLMPDGGLVFIDNQGPLVRMRIDACSNIQWITDGQFHDSLERDLNGNFIVPGVAEEFEFPTEKFRDDEIVRISVDGQVIERLSVARILLENGYNGLLFIGNPFYNDPIHLNDIEVAFTSTANWQRGDWLLSARNLNTILIYRPSTQQITWLQTGPWLKQHDPDFQDDGSIAVFGNDVYDLRKGGGEFVSGHSDIYIVTPGSTDVETPYTDILARERVGTPTQGLSQILENGDVFVEETDYGRLLRVGREGLVWTFYNSNGEKSGLLNWSRYLPKEYLENVDISTECDA